MVIAPRKLFRFTVALLTAGVSLAAGMHAEAQVDARTCGSALYDPYQEGTSFWQACGYGIDRLERIVTLADGGKGYVYSGGTLNVPPPDFNPLTAGSDELKIYGIPPRPGGGAALDHWATLYGKNRFHAPGQFVLTRPIRSTPPISNTAYDTGQRWAGFIAEAGTTTYVHGEWPEETTPQSQPCNNPYLSVWVGVGGYLNNSQLLDQVGTAPSSPGNAYDYGWWEYTQITGTQEVIPFWQAQPGTDTAATVQVAQRGGYDQVVWIIDNPAGSEASGSQDISSSDMDLSTGELIVERPLVSGNLVPLMEFDSPIVWSNAWINNQNSPLGDYNNVNISAWNYDTDNELAHPGSLYNGGTQFNTYFDSCD